MNFNIINIIVALLIAGIFIPEKADNHLPRANGKSNAQSGELTPVKGMSCVEDALESDCIVQDVRRVWNNSSHNYKPEFSAQKIKPTGGNLDLSEPIEINWKVLMNIKYELRYFSEIDMEIYAPVFSKAVTALHEKTVVIEGFVIPFDEEEDLLSLSFNPYASCFFCGNASPASIISLYLKEKGRRYKIDDFRKFQGTLHLNQDDPNEFYYILRDAEEVQE